MTGLSRLLGVARYERILLMRTMRYRVLGAVGAGIPIFAGVILAIAEARGGEGGTAFGLGAIVPFYFYSFLQTLVIAFIAGDFRAADERAHVHEVIAVRPLSTTELVVGKYLGVLQSLLALSLLVMGVTVVVQAAKLSIMGTPFRAEPYLGYFLLMNLPGLIYMTALTFFLGAMLRQRTAAALVALAYIIGTVFFLGDRYGGIFDFGAFYAPLFYSDILGFGDLSRVIALRVFYVALAAVLLGLSVERFPRLPQSGAWRWGGRLGTALAAGLAVALFIGMRRQDRAGHEFRVDLMRASVTRASEPAPEVLHYDLAVDLLGAAGPLAADARIRVRNPGFEPLDELLFTLNPGLRVATVTEPDGAELDFERDGSVLVVALPTPLVPEAETTIRIGYAGHIDRDGFDLLRTAPRKEMTDGPLHLPELTAWIRPQSVYLPPRSGWYPRAGVDYGHAEPPLTSFATATLDITAPAPLTVITQGDPTATTDAMAGMRTSSFSVDRSVPVLSLNAGIFRTWQITIDGVELALHVHPDHALRVTFFDDATEAIIPTLRQLLGAMVRETGLPYPYTRLDIVEVPMVVQWYYEGWREVGGLTQPGVLMIEEDVLGDQRFERNFNRRQQRAEGDIDAASIKRDLLVASVFRVFLSPESQRYGLFRSPLVQLWSFDRAFIGQEATLLERGMPIYLQQDVGSEVRSMVMQRGRGGFGGRFRRGGRGRDAPANRDLEQVLEAANETRGSGSRLDGADWDAVLAAMQKQSFADMNPEADPELYRAVLDTKGMSVFRMMKAVVGADAFVSAVSGFADSSRYQGVDFDSFQKAVLPAAEKPAAESSVSEPGPNDPNLDRLVQAWLYGTSVPGYTITRAVAHKRENARGAVVHQVIVRIRNGEPALGFVEITAGGFRDEVSKGVQIEGGTEVEVALVIADRPARVTVEPFFAKNRRALIAPLRVADTVEPGRPETYVRLVTEEAAPFAELIVDNEDEGFSMPVRRVQRFLRPGLEGDNWRTWTQPFAFGRYETNFRWKRPGDGAQPAIWTTTVPRAGEYDVAYYFLPERMAGRRLGVWGVASEFEITVVGGGATETMQVRTDELNGGWNLLGRFEYAAGDEVSVELSDRADGRLYADAVRWRLVDPNVIYEADVAPWEGRRTPGPGRARLRRLPGQPR